MDRIGGRAAGWAGKFDLTVFWAGAVRLRLIYYLRLIITPIIIVTIRPETAIARALTRPRQAIDRNRQSAKVVKASPVFPRIILKC